MKKVAGWVIMLLLIQECNRLLKLGFSKYVNIWLVIYGIGILIDSIYLYTQYRKKKEKRENKNA